MIFSRFGREKTITGSMLLEFVLVMPILFTLIMAVIQFAQVWMVRQIVSYSAYCATRSTLSANPAEQYFAANKAARQVLAWVAMLGGDSGVDIPGWGDIPKSAAVDTPGRLSVSLDLPTVIRNVSGQKPVVAAVTVSYKFPLLIPVAGPLMSRSYLPGEVFPYIQFEETCVLPMPYSTLNYPIGAYKYF